MSFATNDQTSNGLQGLLSSTPYQASSPDQLPEGVNLGFAGEQPSGLNGEVVDPNIAAPVAHPRTPGVTPSQPVVQQQPSVDPAIMQRLQESMFQAATARIEAEEAKFEATIANLPDWQKQQERDKRELEQTRAVNQWMNQREASREATAQESAKRQWGFLIATQHGLSFSDPLVREVILTSNSHAEMRQKAGMLQQRLSQQAVAAAQSQGNNGIFAAGGTQATGNPGPKPVMRSGDLDTLISATPYQLVSM